MTAGLPEILRYIGGIHVYQEGKLDLEWLYLIREALELGISKEEIVNFLRTPELVEK